MEKVHLAISSLLIINFNHCKCGNMDHKVCLCKFFVGTNSSETAETSTHVEPHQRTNSVQINGGKKESRWRTKSSSTMEVR